MSATYYNVQKWSVQTYNTGSSLWQSATSWPRGSTNTFSEIYASTMKVIDLANGVKAVFTPSTHYNLEQLTLSWNRRTVTSTFLSNLTTYVKEKTGLKITLHDTTPTVLEGYIMNLNKSWEFTGSTQQYNVTVDFLPFDVDSDGKIGN